MQAQKNITLIPTTPEEILDAFVETSGVKKVFLSNYSFDYSPDQILTITLYKFKNLVCAHG